MTDSHYLAALRNLGSAVILLGLAASPLLAKRKDDRVVLRNGDHITGEIKRIERGTLYFKPGYALDDIQIDWTQVERLESQDYFTVGLTDGSVYTGLIKKTPAGEQDKSDFTISTPENVVEFRRAEVVTLQSMEKSRWKQLTGSIDYGFSFASGNNQTQSSLGADVQYRGERNWLTGAVSSTFSGQSTGEDTTRETLSAAYWRRFTPNVFGGFLADLLSSSQQELALRTTLGGALGRTLVRTDKTNSAVFAGLVGSRERYTASFAGDQIATNAEALFGLTYSTFRFKVFDLTSRLMIFPSLSQAGRLRLSSDSSLRWEFIRNMYWSLRIYENFDSRPPINAPRNDFGVTNSLGWTF
jgi:Protein of unknown function, DUF481